MNAKRTIVAVRREEEEQSDSIILKMNLYLSLFYSGQPHGTLNIRIATCTLDLKILTAIIGEIYT